MTACTCGGNRTCRVCVTADLEHIPRFTFAFDFPEGGDPWFPVWMPDGSLGWTLRLKNAARFETEEIAQRVLDNSYGPETAACGVVVEVAL